MTSLALGVHERLVRSGIQPTSDEYYLRIDETMQKRFPENFEVGSRGNFVGTGKTEPTQTFECSCSGLA